MKGFSVLLILFLLCGCCMQTPAPSVGETTAATQTEPTGLYDPGSTAEAETGGALRCYPLNGLSCSGIRALGDGLLLFSGTDVGCTVTRLSGILAVPTAQLTLPFPISASDPALQVWENGFSCYDPDQREILFFDENLQQYHRITIPPDLTNSPLLSRDCATLYYTTSTDIRAQDQTTGISRVIRRYEGGAPEIQALLWQDSVLQCSLGESGKTQFLSAVTGKNLLRQEDRIFAETFQTEYWASVNPGSTTLYVCGKDSAPANLLLFPQPDTRGIYLPGTHGALGLRRDPDAVTIDHYDLATGRRTAGIRFPFREDPGYFTPSRRGIWFAADGNLFCWDLQRSSLRDSQIYTAPYATQSDPDTHGMKICEDLAERMSERYGISIRIQPENRASDPFRFSYLSQPPVLTRELKHLDNLLGQYPEEILSRLSQRFDGLTICIISGIPGKYTADTPDPCCSALVWDNYHAYIALTAASALENPLNHAMCHLMDTIVLNESSAYDTWNEHNPTGFVYDCDYAANQIRNSTAYLQDPHRYFVDMYSMSFPKEDRARILEAAMTPDQDALFRNPAMQTKLTALCTGIREAFDLEEDPRQFPWEQYLLSDTKR